jgi:hypothetical protein
MGNTAAVTGGKPIDVHGGKREVLFFYFVPDTTRDLMIQLKDIEKVQYH